MRRWLDRIRGTDQDSVSFKYKDAILQGGSACSVQNSSTSQYSRTGGQTYSGKISAKEERETVFEIAKICHKPPLICRQINLGAMIFVASLHCGCFFVSRQRSKAQELNIRQVQGMRASAVKPIDENDIAPEDKDDFDDLPTIGDIPADKDIEEGDEEKDDGFDLPPAMPPAV
jgi:hypothetical protein